jgi:hypothetical protein
MSKQEARNKKQKTKNKKQETRNTKQETRNKKQSEGFQSNEYSGCGGSGRAAIHKNCHCSTLLSLLLYVTLHCLHAQPTSFHSSLHVE